MRKDFYIFRHGETLLNAQARIQGSGMDVELNEVGKAQALTLAQKLKSYDLEVIFSSPLKRAMQTAQTVAEVCHCPVLVEDDLRECFYGNAEGLSIAEVKQKYADVYANWANPNFWDIAYPEGETKKAALERVWKQIEELAETPYKTMGVAIHGGTMGSLLNYLHYDFERIENCAVFHLIYDNNWRIEGGLF